MSTVLEGLMQDWPLTLDRVLEHAARWHGAREIVSREADGSLARSSYAAVHRRARQFSNALRAGGIAPGERIATLAMNGARHLEAWFGIFGIGAVCHTVNPRLFDEQLVYIINHAADRWLLADAAFAPLVARILPQCPCVERVIWLGGEAPPLAVPVASGDYESLLAGHSAECRWGGLDERAAAGLCYTSGTTGEPKGVLYSHRSNVLHALYTAQADCFGFRASEVVLPVVPMFHANAWGIPFAAPLAGAKLVMPGARLDGESLFELLETEGVTFSAAVPTVWQALLDFLTRERKRLTTLGRVLIGGAACPEALMRAFREQQGVEVVHAWGMTEMSPLGTTSRPNAAVAQLEQEAQLQYRLTQGRVPFGIDMRIVDDAGAPQPHDGRASGHLQVRGGAILRRYYRASADAIDADGFFDSGDIASIDSEGYMRILDRAKDLVKSGGEWISSVELEGLAAGHPAAMYAAVIAARHRKWGERPLLIVKLRPGCTATREEFLALLKGRVADWWLPDDVLIVEEMPLGATGKFDKKRLRALYGEHLIQSGAEAPERPGR
jgi:fatty-acyl-CoA synthase